MRDRHRQRFQAATAKLREQYKQVCRANRKLETQLLRSSVSCCDVCCCLVYCCLLQDMMKALDTELRSSQGTITELNTAITDVSIFVALQAVS